MLTWFTAHGFADVPHWTWIVMSALFVTETILGRLSDPRWRSLGDTIRNALGIALARIPGGGPLLVQWLQAVLIVPKPDGLDASLAKHLASDDPTVPKAKAAGDSPR